MNLANNNLEPMFDATILTKYKKGKSDIYLNSGGTGGSHNTVNQLLRNTGYKLGKKHKKVSKLKKKSRRNNTPKFCQDIYKDVKVKKKNFELKVENMDWSR